MADLELNKPYSTDEMAQQLFGIKGTTFNAHKDVWKPKLEQCYEYKIVKRKYVMIKKIGDYKPITKHERQYQDIYLPAVLNYMGNEVWTTITGVSIFILSDEQVSKLQHALETAKKYVREVIANEYDITNKKYAACYGSGNYARLMTDEECKQWKELKSKYSTGSSDRIMELTEMYAHKELTLNEYTKELRGVASGAYATALLKWMEKYGFIPVMINHYERKGIEFKDEDEDVDLSKI